MGFKFHRLSPIYKSYISRISSQPHRNPYPYPIYILQNPNFSIPTRWHGGHSHDHHHHHRLKPDCKEGEKIFLLGLAADIGLASGKALTGYLSGSTAIIADAAHSVSDVVLSSIALLSFKASKVPRDEEHPYGHGKFETLGALGISCMLLATGGGIAWHTFELLLGLLSTAPDVANQSLIQVHEHNHHNGAHHHGIDMDHPILALNMTLVSIGVKEGLYWITKRAGERQGSGLMKANAWHHRADAVSSFVALIGVGGSILGVKFLDPLAGFVVSGMIFKAGLETGYQSVLELVDAAIPGQELDPIKQTILQVEGVKGCHRLRARRAGSSLYLDVHIVVDPLLSVSTAHDIGENVRHQIHKSYPEVAEVFIHIDPAISEVRPSLMDRQENPREMAHKDITDSPEGKDVEAVVSNIILSEFPEILAIEHITRHTLQGKTLLQIEVSMPTEFLIRDAARIAEAAEKEILKAASNVAEKRQHGPEIYEQAYSRSYPTDPSLQAQVFLINGLCISQAHLFISQLDKPSPIKEQFRFMWQQPPQSRSKRIRPGLKVILGFTVSLVLGMIAVL